MEYLAAIALGFVGSLHCAVMCGPLQLAIAWPAQTARAAVAGRLIYHFSRIAIYCLLGLFAGLVGHAAALNGLQKSISIAMGVAILFGLLFSKKLSPAVFRALFWLRRFMQFQLQQRGWRSVALLGLLNGLLPCGLVYVATAGAVSLGDPLAAPLWMAAFGLGTLPMTLGISFSGRFIPASLRLKYRGLGLAAMIALSALLIVRGFEFGIPYLSPKVSEAGVMGCCAHSASASNPVSQ